MDYSISWDDAKRRAVGMVLVVLAAAALLTPSTTGYSYNPRLPDAMIVRATPGALGDAVGAVRRAGGTVVRSMDSLDMAAVRLPSRAAATRVAADSSVRNITSDRRLRLLHSVDGYDGSTDAGSLHANARAIGAHDLWGAGLTGAGVDVAIIDSGIAPAHGLTAPAKVVNGADLSFESQVDNLRYLDSYGHGSHLAGIIAGRDARAGSDSALVRDHDSFVGIAPDARLVNVKVADALGGADVSQVIAAIDWVVQHRRDNGLNIRVLNLSFGTDGTQSYLNDPLSYAAEVAWRHGIVVVTAAGNGGSDARRLLTPAVNPFVLAVGADATKGTTRVSDDHIPAFSSAGDGTRNPDVVAPGVSLASSRVPNSYVDSAYSGGRVNGHLFRGSGTSQAAAVVSGAAALLLEQRPELSPDQVKALLTGTAKPVPNVSPTVQGSGLVDLKAAAAAPTPNTVQTWAPATGRGALEGSRGSLHLVRDGVTLEGERDIFGASFDSGAWADASAAGTSWSGGTWNGNTWSGSSWSGSSWSGSSWSGSSWSGSSWSGSSWSGSSWSANYWNGSSWSGSSWSGSSWSGSSWSGSSWSTLYWG